MKISEVLFKIKRHRHPIIALGFILRSSVSHSCATCGCTLDTQTVTGIGYVQGPSIGLEFSYIPQTQYRHASGSTSWSQVVNHPAYPSLNGGEIERGTFNRYTTLNLNERFNSRWTLSLLVPWISRSHDTWGQQSMPYTSEETSASQLSHAEVRGLGDIKILSNYQGLLHTHNLGISFGLKLPTGAYGGSNPVGQSFGHPVLFQTGPDLNTPLDASLQAGTGSTDLLLGGYYFQSVSKKIDVFVNTSVQTALIHALQNRSGSYRPGNQFLLSIGALDHLYASWSPQFELNYNNRRHDQGTLADPMDTAGQVLYFSPGISFSTQKTYIFSFLQIPAYSQLSGYQLFPRWTVTLGFNRSF